MTTYTVQGPSGKSYTIEGPQGATADQLGQVILANSHDERVAAEVQRGRAEYDPTKDMSPAEMLVAGASQGVDNLKRGIGQVVGKVLPEKGTFAGDVLRTALSMNPTTHGLVAVEKSQADIDEAKKLDQPLLATTPGKVGSVIGSAVALAPTMAIPGVNGYTGAALLGGATGALQPVASDEGGYARLVNTGLGAAGGAAGTAVGKGIGAAATAAVRTARAAKAAAEPFYAEGQKRIVGNALNAAAGDAAPEVANLLAQASQPFVGPSQPGLTRNVLGELVPGSVPTVGQASGNAGVAALERAAAAMNPEVTTQLSNRYAAQNAARTGLLQEMAGTGGARDFAAANRAGTSDQLYGAARAAGIDPAALTPEAQANIAKMQARIPKDILNEAKSLAQINGAPLDDTTSLTGLHYVKMALDDAISSAKAAGNATKARALAGLQQDFLTGLDRLSPDYAAARATHAAMSEPVNQMDVAQALLNKSLNPLSETLQPAAYARALNDQTAKTATGFSGATLENTLTNQQSNLLQSILEDVRRSNAAQNAGRGVGSDTVQKLAYSHLLDQAGIPTWLRNFTPAQVAGNVAARVGDAAYARQNRELANLLAQTTLSPEDAASAMRAAASQGRPNELAQLLAPYLPRLGAVSAPAAVQSRQR